MKFPALAAAVFLAAPPVCADFSYKVVTKPGGAMASMAGGAPSVSTYYYKGQKMKTDNGTVATIIDFDARTVTIINKSAKTVAVRSFDDANGAAGKVNANIDVKETGQKKNVNGFNASELLMTMRVEAPPGRMAQMGPMQVTMNMWLSSEVPGLDQVYEFHRRNAANFPWAAMQGNTNSPVAAQMAEVQRKIVSMHGIPVQQVIRMNPSGGSAGAPAMPQMPQVSPARQAQMAQARQRLEAMAAQGGPAAAAAQQALARMGGIPGAGAGAPAASGAMFELTLDSSDFSSATIPDSVFAVPADYQKAN